MTLPLADIKVLDLTRAWAPFDHGESCFFLSVNRNKRGLAVDFRNSQGLETLRRLAGLVEEVQHPLIGKLKTMAKPLRLGAMEEASVRRPPPTLGQHSAEVLLEFGWSRDEVVALAAAGV